MSRKPDIDIPVIRGEHRQVERNDKPPHVPGYMFNQQQKKEGVWERRPGTGYLHPDRGEQFQFTQPLINRGIDTYCGGESGNMLNSHDYLYNCHKRKVIALGETDVDGVKTQYVFMGVILDHYRSGEYQELKVYRGIVSRKSDGSAAHVGEGVTDPLDGVTITWDAVPTYNALARVAHKRSSTCFIEYSMKINAAMDKIYIVIGLRDDDVEYHSVVRVVELTNLYDDAWTWDGNVTPVWTQDSAHIIRSSDANTYITNDIDIDIDNDGDLHVIFGYRLFDGVDVLDGFNYWKYDVGASGWSLFHRTYNTERHLRGVVLKNNPYEDKMYLGYLSKDANIDESRIMQIKFNPAAGSTPPDDGDATVIAYNPYYVGGSLNRYDCGPAVAIDTDGTVYYAYKTSKTTISFATKSTDGSSSRDIVETAEFGIYGGDTDIDILTNWDIAVKSGVLHVYYVHVVRHSASNPHRFSPADYFEIRRATYIFDTTDADYKPAIEKSDGGLYLQWSNELVETHLDLHTYLCCYNTFESDSPKRLTFIRYDYIGNGVALINPIPLYPGVAATSSHQFAYIRQDRGIRWGLVEMSIKMPQRFNSRNTDGTEIITVLQCLTQGGFVRWFERGDWQWDLLQGQFDRDNDGIAQETTVEGRASMWSNNGVLRAGCGIEEGNTPIWDALIDRNYFNDTLDLQIRRRHFQLDQIFPPNIAEDFARDSIVQISLLKVSEHGIVVPGTFPLPNHESFIAAISLDDQGNASGNNKVSHAYKTIGDLDNSDLGEFWRLADQSTKQPYIDVFVGFAYRYDNGQVSQITPQSEDDAWSLGYIFRSGTGMVDPDSGVGLQYIFRLRRHDFTGDITIDPKIPAIDPRITSIIVFVGEKTSPDVTKYDAVYRKWKEVYVAKSHETPFLDEPENGDSVWIDAANGIMELTGYLDFRQYQINAALENMVDYIGVGNALSRSSADESSLSKHYLEGYKHAAIIEERPHYFGIRMNGKKWEEHAIWAADAVQGGVRFVVPDVVDPAFRKIFPFKLINGKGVGNDNIVYIGDCDLVLARVTGDPLEWQFIKTIQDVGAQAEWAVAVIAEAAESGNLSGVFFVGLKTGGRVFDLYKAVPSTNDVNSDYVAGSNPAGTRVETTHKGVVNFADDDAMAIHLPEYRLFLLHFPNDGITKVRDFRAEDHAHQGFEWLTWEFAHNPKAWCVAPEGYLIYTDGDQVLRFPKATDDGKDVDTAIQVGGRIDIGTPDKMDAEFQEIGLKYKCVGSTLTVTLVRDDGVRGDMTAVFPARAVKGEDHIRVGWQKKINEELSIEWELTDPDSCTAFELHKIFGYMEGQRVK